MAWVACAWSTHLSPLWPWFDSCLRPYVSRVVVVFSLMPRSVIYWPSGLPPSGKIKHFGSLAVLLCHTWVNVVGCQRHLYMSAAQPHCQLWVRIISLANYYYYYWGFQPSAETTFVFSRIFYFIIRPPFSCSDLLSEQVLSRFFSWTQFTGVDWKNTS